MESAHPPPVEAVVLARPSRNESKGTVLCFRESFPRFGDNYRASDMSTASALAVAAKARAEKDYPRWEFEGPARVYDYNPTDKPLHELKDGRQFELQLNDEREELDSDTPLHGHQDPNTHEIVKTFFVLVTAFDPAVQRIHVPPRGIGRRAAHLIRPARPIGFFARWRLRFVQVSLESLDPQLATLSQHGGLRECIKAFATQLQLGGSVQRLRGQNIQVTVEGTAANVQRFLDELDDVWCQQLAMITPLCTLADVTITKRPHTEFQILKDLCCASLVETGRYSPDDHKTHTSRSASQEMYVNSDV